MTMTATRLSNIKGTARRLEEIEAEIRLYLDALTTIQREARRDSGSEFVALNGAFIHLRALLEAVEVARDQYRHLIQCYNTRD